MRASRYMLVFYASIIGVPLLLYLMLIADALGAQLVGRALLVLASLGLIAFGAMGFAEVWAHGPRESADVAVEPRRAAAIPVYHAERGGGGRRIVSFSVARFIGEKKAVEREAYRVEVDGHSTVLSALLSIKERQDQTLAIRYSCRMGICGSCGMVVNGKPVLACETNALKAAEGGEIDVEPMYGHPLLKDLVTDFDDFFERHVSVEPGRYRLDSREKYAAKEAYKQSREEIDRYLPYSYCISCGLCLDACPVVNSNPEFIGPQALSQAYRYHADSLDQRGEERLLSVDSLAGVWGCEFAGACSKVCPKGVDPAAAIQLLKGELMKDAVVGKKDK